MKDNGLLKYYRTLGSRDGLLHVDGIPMTEAVEHFSYGKTIKTLTDEDSGNKFYIKKCSPKEQAAEVLLSQIYAKAGFDTAIYLPTDDGRVISNDVGKNGEIAQDYFLKKVAEDRAKVSPQSAKSLLESKVIDARTLGICYVPRYIKYFTPEGAEKYFEMRGFDIASINADRHLNGFLIEQNDEGLASRLNIIDYGYSAIVQDRPFESKYCSLIDGKTNMDRSELLWHLRHDGDVLEHIDPNKLAEKIGSIDVVATAKDIESTIGFKPDQDFVDNIAYSFNHTAFDLAHS